MKVILTQDNFYNCSILIDHANGSAQPLVLCDVDETWYDENSSELPTHSEVIEDTETLLITNKNL